MTPYQFTIKNYKQIVFGRKGCVTAMQTKLPTGIENFMKMRIGGFYYVDKTGLIRSEPVYSSETVWKDTEYEYAKPELFTLSFSIVFNAV